MYHPLESPPQPVPRQIPLVAEPGEAYFSTYPQWVEVLVDCPGIQGLYTYRIPCELSLQPGDILSVPFGTQQVGAIAIRLLTQLPPELSSTAVRSVEDIVSRGFFPAFYWSLLERVACYYCTSLMQVVRTALPPGLLGRSQRRIRLNRAHLPVRLDLQMHSMHPTAQHILELLQTQKQGNYSWNYLQRQVRGASRGLRDLLQRGWVESYLEPPAPVRPKQRQAVTLLNAASTDVSPRQQEILDVLKRRGGEMWMQDLLQACQTSSSVLKTLAHKGYILIQPREVLRMATAVSLDMDSPKALTAAQTAALHEIQGLHGYAQVLLHGVTGSGKTEVYLQAIAPILQRGQSALVLVPEIGLTPQLTDRFRARFGEAVRVYHSALSEGERYDTWRQMLTPEPQIVIGTRSAIFAPLPNLGLVILDEEHDGSFKQEFPAPCYHTRTVAQWKAELADCPLMLGSATPSLETWVSCSRMTPTTSSATLCLSLPQRIHDRPMPRIEVVDMRRELQQGNRSIFSRSLHSALQEMKQQGQQGLLFIHRRGHSTFVSCRSCGHVMDCPHCDVSLTYHQTQIGGYESLRCHYCGHGQPHVRQCPSCGSPYLKHFGSGTQRIMQEIAYTFPDLRCLRFDSDTTRTKGAHRTLLTRFAQGEADLLVGTQMLTKGIDLPQVTLVGIIAADGVLHLSDFRASERAFQTLLQVAGRAGRGTEPGRVILQTYSPQHSVVQAVVEQDYAAFAEAELQHREALGYPPYGTLVALRLSGVNAETVETTAETIAEQLRSQLAALALPVEVLGPAPATIVRVSRRYRWQILLKGNVNCATPAIPDYRDYLDLEQLRSACPSTVSLSVDVDPLQLL